MPLAFPRLALVAVVVAVPLAFGACQSTTFSDVFQGGGAGGSKAQAQPSVSSGARAVPPPPSYSVTPVPRPAPPPLKSDQAPAGAAATAPAGQPAQPGQPGEVGEPQTTVISGAEDSAVRVALLLPLTGTNAGIGQAMLNAAQMALFAFAGDNFKLLTHDTHGTAEGAREAAQLAIGDGAKLILGPLLASSVSAMTPVAQKAHVPVIAFSSDRGVAGDGIFTLGFLPSPQVDRVVSYARGRGVVRYAALAPDNPYGHTVVAAYKAAVARAGGQVTRVKFYNPEAEDYSAVVRDLADYEYRRSSLLAQKKELEGKTDEVARRALARLGTLQTLGDLPYDALLVPDGGKRLQAIAALLPYYDIDPNKVRMLGTGQWDEPNVGAEPALVGGWYAAPPPEARAQFEQEYSATYGKAPPRLATIAYDAAALAAVLGQAAPGGRFTEKAISNPNGFAGRDGIFRFLSDGTAQRGLAILQVRQHDAVVINKAPATFQSATN